MFYGGVAGSTQKLQLVVHMRIGVKIAWRLSRGFWRGCQLFYAYAKNEISSCQLVQTEGCDNGHFERLRCGRSGVSKKMGEPPAI